MAYEANELDFTYAVARIRAKETELLNSSALESLISCPSFEDCMRILYDRGWGYTEKDTPGEMLEAENAKTWALVRELCNEEQIKLFDIFMYGKDFHNLKAAIKEAYIQKEAVGVYESGGTVDVELIRKCARESDFIPLPAQMAACAREAYDVLFHTGDSQLSDVIIDKAALEAIYAAGMNSGNELMEKYVELKVAAADINIAVRGCKTGKDTEFLARAFADCKMLDTYRLIEAARGSVEAVYEYLETTIYKDAVDAIKLSPSSFDKWCDDRMMKEIESQKYNPFSISPIAAYVLARENEIKSVKIILTGKQNNLPEEAVRERIRATYV